MDVAGRIALVTGAGAGIGRALALALGARGAARVICCDLDMDAAMETAELCPAPAEARHLDVVSRSATERVVADVEEQDGPIDLFCANAGILTLGGVELPQQDWQRIWDVNVMAHVHAAHVMVPRWRARGGGYLVTTASAAGLLSQVGSAPYSVTKHAAVGFAEWLHFTHARDGIGVSVLCPQAVDTAMIRGHEDGVASIDGVRSPEEVAAAALAGISERRFLILPHPKVADYMALKSNDPEKWLSGMARLNDRFGG